MDLIKYLEDAAIEVDAFWRFREVQPQFDDAVLREGAPFGDNTSLTQLLEVRPTMICMIVAPDGGDTEEAEESPDTQVPSEDDVDEGTVLDSEP